MKSTVIFNGGLGNQLFQYAFMLYLRDRLYYQVDYDNSIYNMANIHEGFQADEIFDFSSFAKSKRQLYSVIKVNKKLRNVWRSEKRILIGDDIAYYPKQYRYYVGYWQKALYYESVQHEIKRSVKQLDRIIGDVPMRSEIQAANSVSLHIRRGDYISNSLYSDLAGTKYYERAIMLMKERERNVVFFIFSDDITWCREYLKSYDGIRFVEYANQTAVKDLCLMAQCKNSIIANSSFSWWGAALTEKANVLYPDQYYANTSAGDMYPKAWIKIKVKG